MHFWKVITPVFNFKAIILIICILMTQFNVKGRYTDRYGRSHNFRLISDSSDRRYIEDLVHAQYPAKDVFINIVNQDLR